MSDNTSQAADLFNVAMDMGDLGPDSVALLDPLQTEINAALAQGPKKKASKVVLVTINIDNSPSMKWKVPGQKESNWDIACGGHNLVFDSLVASKAAKTILGHSTFLNPFDGNNGVYFPFTDLVLPDHTAKGPKPNFRVLTPGDGKLLGLTPLCDTIIRVLGGVQLQATDYLRDGSDVFTITIVLSDGGENDSQNNEADVATLIGDMRQQERHKIYFGGIDDGDTDFVQFGMDCGLDKDCVRQLPNDPSQIRAWLEQVSQSAVAGSEAADVDAFSQVTL